MTRRLYYDDSYLSTFQAQVLSVDGPRVILDATAFYPTSGGQPFDTGTINGIPVTEVEDLEDGTILHTLAEPSAPLTPGPAHCAIDWPRRFDHMQQHTGQHILSAIFGEHFQIPTLSFHLGRDLSTIDIATPSLTDAQLREAERLANAAVFEARPVTVSYTDAAEAAGLRKESERTGTLRIVTIEGLDRSACGGTHVRTTAEAGPIFLRKTEKIRGSLRIEFVAGSRAVARARADFDALTRAARQFSSAIDEVDTLIAAQAQRLAAAEKELRRLAAESAQREGRERYAALTPNAKGWTAELRTTPAPMSDESRLRATAFIESGPAVWIELFPAANTVMLACSPATNLNAGAILKPLLTANGGRGGGGATLAQGSLPNPEALAAVESALRELIA